MNSHPVVVFDVDVEVVVADVDYHVFDAAAVLVVDPVVVTIV